MLSHRLIKSLISNIIIFCTCLSCPCPEGRVRFNWNFFGLLVIGFRTLIRSFPVIIYSIFLIQIFISPWTILLRINLLLLRKVVLLLFWRDKKREIVSGGMSCALLLETIFLLSTINLHLLLQINLIVIAFTWFILIQLLLSGILLHHSQLTIDHFPGAFYLLGKHMDMQVLLLEPLFFLSFCNLNLIDFPLFIL